MEANNSQLVIYQAPDGNMSVDVTVKGESIWLTQRQIADLFGTQRQAITKHLKNIYATGELDKEATSSKMELVQMEGHNGEGGGEPYQQEQLRRWSGAQAGRLIMKSS